MEGFLMPGCGRILSGCDWLHEPQTVGNQPNWLQMWLGFHTVGGDIVPGDHRFRCRFVGVVNYRSIIYPGMWPYPPRVRLAPRTLANQQSAIMWLGFPHRAGRHSPGGSSFLLLIRWSCKRMEGFFIPEWSRTLPGCERTVTLPRGDTLASRPALSN